MAERKSVLIFSLVSLALIVGGNGCAKQSTTKKKTLVKDCVLPQDQIKTLSGRWRAAPVPIAFKSGDLDSTDQGDIVKAADTWNTFYTASLGLKVIDYGTAASPNQSSVPKPATNCVTGILTGSTFTGQVVIYRQSTWPYSNHDAIALTTFCPQPANPIPNLYAAYMEVNFQDFFVDGKKQPDMQSIFTHELGHLVGLNHSCDTKGKDGFPTCNSKLPLSYLDSVLYPQILFDTSGAGEVRHDLTENDQGRANCLYKDLAASLSK